MILLKVNINKKTHMSFRVLLKIGMPVQNGILNILEMVTCDKITLFMMIDWLVMEMGLRTS